VIDPIAGRFEFDLMGQTPAWYSITVLFVLFVLLRKLVHSPLGATFKAVKDNALRAKAVGIHVNARVRLIYTLAAGVAGVAGALMSQTTGFASLDVFSMDRSADVMLMLVMGGVGWLYGGIVGAVTFKLMYDVIASITPQYWTFWMGLFLVVLMRVGRERLFRPWLWWRSTSKELS
jgi:branched-chain amino acid transport system permease protein